MAARYWVGGTGNWNDTAKWSATSGGATGASVPVAADTVTFDSNSDVGGNPFTMTIPTSVSAVCTSITIASTMTDTVTFLFSSTSSSTLNVSGALNVAVATSAVVGIVIKNTGTSSMTVGSIVHTGGTFSFDSSTDSITSGSYSTTTSGANSRYLNLSNGVIKITQTGTTTPWNVASGSITIFSSGTVQFTGNLSSGSTRTIVHAGVNNTAGNAISFKISNGLSGSITRINATTEIGSLDFSGYAGSWTNTALTLRGSLTLSTSMTVASGINTVTFSVSNNSTLTLKSNGKSMDFPIVFNGVNSTWTLQDAFVNANSTSLINGTFNASVYSVTTSTFTSSNSNIRSILMGTGTWTLTGAGTVWDLATTTNLTFTKSTANIVLTSTSISGRIFAGGGLTYNNLTIGGATGTSTLTLMGSNTFATFASTKTVAHTILFTGGTTTTVTSWTVTGTAGNVVTLGVSDVGTYTLTSTTSAPFQINYMSISNGNATPGSTWYAAASTDGGGNTGFIFSGVPLYWRGGTGTWSSTATTNWSTTSGGASSGIAPTIENDVYFDTNSDATAIFTVTISAGATCNNVTVGPLDFTMTLAGSAAWSIGGSLTFPATNFTPTYTGDITFTSGTSNTITTSGNTLASAITFNGTGSWTLSDALLTTGTSVTLIAGTLALSSYTLTTPIFLTSNSNVRTINFGTGKIVLTAATASTIWTTATSTNLTVSGTSLVETTGGGAVAKTINTVGMTEAQSINFSLLNTAGDVAITSNSVFKNLTINMAAVQRPAANLTLYGNFDLIARGGITSGGVYTFAASSGIQTIKATGSVAVNFTMSGSSSTTYQLLSNLTLISSDTLTLNSGIFDANNYNVTAGRFSSNNTNTRTITMGSGTWTIANASGIVWNVSSTNCTLNSNTSTIILSADQVGVDREFNGGSLTYNNLTIGGSQSGTTTTFFGDNTFNTFASSKTLAHTIKFGGGSENTFTSFTVSGTSGFGVTITSTNTQQVTLAKPTIWYVGSNSTNGGNNTNLVFSGGNNLNYLNLSYINGSPEVPASSGFFMFCV